MHYSLIWIVSQSFLCLEVGYLGSDWIMRALISSVIHSLMTDWTPGNLGIVVGSKPTGCTLKRREYLFSGLVCAP